LRTSVLQWWATWPALETGEDAGVVLSDRALLRLEQGGALDGEIAPAALYDTLEKTWAGRRETVRARVASALSAGMPSEVSGVIDRAASLDAAIVSLAGETALSNVDLQVVYLPGLDIAQHGLLSSDTAVGGATPAAASTIAARIVAIETYYAFLDGLLADLTRAQAGDRRTIVLVTQPGRVAAPGPGLVALTGGPERHLENVRPRSTPTSIAATTLYLLGMPVAADLAGPVITPLIAERFLTAHPMRSIDTYGTRRIAPRRSNGKPLDREMIDRMRSLGYVK
jgi:hypothetical protein